MIDLSDIKSIRKLDRSNMLDILLGLPGQCRDAAKIAARIDLPGQYKPYIFDNVFFTGLGGSAIGGDIVKTYLSADISAPVIVNRNYDIPAFVGKKTLAFVCSYSGNTEETISAYGRIKKTGAKIIAITSGGRLKTICKQDKIPCILIPAGIPPRTAIGYMSVIPLVVLSRIGLIKNQANQLKEAIGVLAGFKNNIAKNIAEKIYNKFVIIYAAEDFLGGVATRWRQELEENSKILCLSGLFPEMNHNEITGWEDVRHISKGFAVICLRDKSEHSRVSRRIEISKELIRRKTKNIIEVRSTGKSLLARTFSLIYTGAFVSFYLAMLNNVDPTPVNNVTYLKKKLARKK